MYLEKLELQGFKSFADKSTLDFSPGVTAIVGPNGSGKSNVADAIRWVLGEQSMKTLRGKKSEDVIFAGTKNRSRMGMAEVSLFLNNEDGQMPIDYSHVVITRRLFRNGESEYLINKNKARLLDIQELLAKAGFGQKTYSVIGQGMIDAFLKAGPKERRELFEEAAGIKQFQIKRNISSNKLANTKTNLLRAQDLLNEILPRVRSLKRQASKAERKEVVKKELTEKQHRYLNHLWNKIEKKISDKRQGTASIKQQEVAIEQELTALSAKIDNREKNITPAAKENHQQTIDNLHQEKNRLEEKIAVLRGKLQIEKEKEYKVDVSEINRRLDQLSADEQETAGKLTAVTTEKKQKLILLENKATEEKKFIQDINAIQAKLRELSKHHQAVSNEKNPLDSLRTIYQDQQLFFQELEQCDSLEKLARLKDQARLLQNRLRQELAQLEKNKTTPAAPPADLSAIQEELDQLLSGRSEVEKSINELKISHAVLTTQEKNLQDRQSALNQEKAKLESRLQKAQGAPADQKNIIAGELNEEIATLENDTRLTAEKINQEEQKLTVAREQARQAMANFSAIEKNYRDRQTALNQIKDQLRETEIEIARMETEKGLIKDEITDSFGEEAFSELTAKYQQNPVMLNGEEEISFKDKIKNLKNQLAQIGEIDPEVLKEYQETQRRYDFLSSQKQDLEQASASLKKIIAELDKTISKKFDEALHNINEQFQKYFEILFGGGKARLIKHTMKERFGFAKKHAVAEIEGVSQEDIKEYEEDKEEDLAQESYIEIKANPPGKKLKDLNMLSGGERALTSIALILAIIANNPSPFITLDEVDAALDEANSNRYGKIIKSVSGKTQFITITHNREIMHQAKSIYGVTMSESGISKLLSIQLEEAEKHARE